MNPILTLQCVQRASEELKKRPMARDLQLNKKRMKAMEEKKESVMRKKRDIMQQKQKRDLLTADKRRRHSRDAEEGGRG